MGKKGALGSIVRGRPRTAPEPPAPRFIGATEHQQVNTQLIMGAEGICVGETLDFLLNERHGVEAEESSRLASWVSSGSPLLGAAVFVTLTAP